MTPRIRIAHLGPRAAGIERKAAVRETAERMVGVIGAAGGRVEGMHEVASAAQAAHAGETISELLARDRIVAFADCS